jgi:glutamate racemase
LACHTSSALALETVSRDCPVPIFGVLAPTAQALAQDFTQDRILWLATSASIRANKLPFFAKSLGFRGHILPLACPGWADGVESGSWDTPQFKADIAQHLAAYREEARQNLLVLYGCTHYPWLHPVVSALLPAEVRYLDPSAWVARQVHQGLSEKALLSEEGKQGTVHFLEGNALLQRWHRYQELQERALG